MVAHLLWEQRVAGSNPVTPTNRGHSAAVFSYEPGGVHAVLSHHHDGHDAGTRTGPRRSRGRRAVRHPARILGHRHRLRPASRHRALYRDRRRRSPSHPPRDHRSRAPRRRCAPRPLGSRRARAFPLPRPLSAPGSVGSPRLVNGGEWHVPVWRCALEVPVEGWICPLAARE